MDSTIDQLVITGTPPSDSRLLVTHNGRFHCDDVLAVTLLASLPENANAIVVRTRTPDLLAKGAVVVDVGGVYDPENFRFDHHQRGFDDYFDAEWRKVTKMSSAGMVFKHFGQRILTEAFGVPTEHAKLVQYQLYDNLIESIDALDNGVGITPPGTEPLYKIRSDLTSRVARINEWTGDEVDAENFRKAMKVVLEEVRGHLKFLMDEWLPARLLVEEAIGRRFETHPSGRVIELGDGCPHEDHLFVLEEGLDFPASPSDSPTGILFVIYPYDASSWRLKTVRKSTRTFEHRLSILPDLKGLRDDQIKEMGFPGVTFVHNAGFLAGCSSREAAIQLAEASMKRGNVV